MLWHKAQGAGGRASPLSLNYITNVVSAQAQASVGIYTFSSVSIGDAASDRLVVVCVGAIRGNSTGGRRVASATIGGVSATIATDTNPFGNSVSAIIYAEVPTGTTATVVINFEGNSGSDVVGSTGTIGVYAIYNAKSITPVDNNNVRGTKTPSITLDSESGGGAIFWCVGGFSNTDIYWSANVTEDFLVTETGSRLRSAASVETDSSTISATATATGSANAFLSAATWR